MRHSSDNPIAELVARQGVIILDGGLATALEARGHVLNDELWSAGVLLRDPDAIRDVHRDYLAAGADCITTSSYQATLQGFDKRGLSGVRGIGLLRHSVGIAVGARDEFWADPVNRGSRSRPIVAASIGPYAGFLADGSEYKGYGDVSVSELYEFHRSRWRVLADSRADLLACETIPSLREARALLQLLRETPERWAWLSFACRDGSHLCGGSWIVDAALACDDEPRVAAIGINCTAPEHISELITAVRGVTEKPVIVYPNRGTAWDPMEKSWIGSGESIDWGSMAKEWTRLGVAGVGGCCEVGPEDVATIRQAIVR